MTFALYDSKKDQFTIRAQGFFCKGWDILLRSTRYYDLVEGTERGSWMVARSAAPPRASSAELSLDRLIPQEKSMEFKEISLTDSLPNSLISGDVGGIALIWRDTPQGRKLLLAVTIRDESFHAESADGGESWTKPKKFLQTVFSEKNPFEPLSRKVIQVVKGKGDELLLFWSDLNQGIGLVRGKTPDDWNEQERIPIKNHGASFAADQDGNIWMAYANLNKDNLNIFVTHSDDNGKTWEPSFLVTQPDQHAKNPSIAVHDGKLFVAYKVSEGKAEGIYVASKSLADLKKGEQKSPDKQPELKPDPLPKEEKGVPGANPEANTPALVKGSDPPSSSPWGWLLLGGAAATLAAAGIMVYWRSKTGAG